MFCDLGKEERARFRKKKEKKKEKQLIVAKSGLVRMKGYLKANNRMKIFFAGLRPFLNEIAFYVKLSGQFLGSKTKVLRQIASKFDAKHVNQ